MRKINSNKLSKIWHDLYSSTINVRSVDLFITNESCHWHDNDDEIFAVLNGMVNMHYRKEHQVIIIKLNSGDVFFGNEGTEHKIYSIGEARILIIKQLQFE